MMMLLFLEQYASNSYFLSLSTGQVYSIVIKFASKPRMDTFRQSCKFFSESTSIQGFHNIVIIARDLIHHHIFSNTGGKQLIILKNRTKMIAVLFNVILFDINAVIKDLAFSYIVKPHE